MSARFVDVICDVDIEQTRDSFHAHAIPDGIEIRPGDTVVVHDAPRVGFGEHVRCRCRATVIRGNALQRVWAHVQGLLELTTLYEVGFEAREV